MQIATARLDLVATTLELISSEIESSAKLAAMLNTQVGDDWPPGEYDRAAQEMFRDWLASGGQAVVGWYGWYAVRRAANDLPAVLIGAGGFMGLPNEHGSIETGFSILPAWRNQGFATELVQALTDWAFNDPRVQTIIAHTTDKNTPSQNVLKRVGFRCVGPGDEPDFLRFELPRKAAND
jgi:RimJ/RimL family protein N-acetyltransferase